MNLGEKCAVITGGGTGVGKATALMLASRGCSVLINYSRSKDAAESVAEEARKTGVQAFAYRADVASDADCRALMAEADRRFGKIDILINNAGTTRMIAHANLEDVSDQDWDNMLGVNLRGPFQCTRAARALLEAEGGGEVVMTSSVAGLAGLGSSIPYCCSKAGLNNLTLTLARVLAPHVRVNAVAPGFIAGEWLQKNLGEAYEFAKKRFAEKSLLQRVSTAQDVADAILGLIVGSDMVTGHVVPVEGGILLNQV